MQARRRAHQEFSRKVEPGPPRRHRGNCRGRRGVHGPEKFGEQFTCASDESLRAVAEAVIGNDRSAYQMRCWRTDRHWKDCTSPARD
jgi:hypothetical protein